MAGFEGELRDVQAARAPRNFGRVRVPGSGLPELIAGAGTLLAGGAKVLAEKADDELVSKFDLGFTKALDAGLDNLEKFKKSGEQSGNSGVKAFTNDKVRAFIKTFKQQNPGNEEFVLEQLRLRGLILPGLEIVKDQAALDKREEQADFARREAIVNKMSESGQAAHEIPGDPTSPVDIEKTLQLAHIMATIKAEQERINRENGVITKPSGEKGHTFSPTYLKNMKAQAAIITTGVLTGMRPALARLSELLALGGSADLKEMRDLQQQVAIQARTYRVAQLANIVDLNPAEKKHYMELVDSTLLSVTQGILDIKDIKELNQAQGLKAVMLFASLNSQFFVASELRMLHIIAALSPKLLNDLLILAKTRSLDNLPDLVNAAEIDLNVLADYFSKEKDPVKVRTPRIDRGEAEHGTVDRINRVQLTSSMLDKFITEARTVENSHDAHLWVSMMGPLWETYNVPTDKVKFSGKDKSQLAKKMLHPNFLLNLEATGKFHPDAEAEVGAFSFDVVQGELFNIVREVQNATTFGAKGTIFEIVYNPDAKKWVIVERADRATPKRLPLPNSAIVSPDAGRPAAPGKVEFRQPTHRVPGQRGVAEMPELVDAAKRINNITRHLLAVRKHKFVFETTTEAEFIEDMARFVTGDITEITHTPKEGDSDVGGEEAATPEDRLNKLLDRLRNGPR